MGTPKVPRPERKPSVFRTAAWAVSAIALLALAVGTQLDFATEKNEYLAAQVPALFASKARIEATDQALDGSAADVALQRAEELVKARPVPAESLTRLARAALLEDRQTLANEALFEAARRGWRDPIAQVAILEGALLVDDWSVVAQRLSAMRKLRYPRELTDRRMAIMAEHPEGRAELVRQFGQDPFWLQQFASYGPEILTAATFAGLIDEVLPDVEAAQHCAVLLEAAAALVAAHEGALARDLWQVDCRPQASSPATLALNAQLGDEELSPFSWQYQTSPGLSRRVTIAESAPKLTFTNRGKIRRVVALKRAAVPAGDYVLQIAGTDSAGLAGIVEPQVLCTETAKPLNLRQTQSGTWSLQIPDTGCEVQRVRISVGTGKGEISDISLTKL